MYSDHLKLFPRIIIALLLATLIGTVLDIRPASATQIFVKVVASGKTITLESTGKGRSSIRFAVTLSLIIRREMYTPDETALPF